MAAASATCDKSAMLSALRSWAESKETTASDNRVISEFITYVESDQISVPVVQRVLQSKTLTSVKSAIMSRRGASMKPVSFPVSSKQPSSGGGPSILAVVKGPARVAIQSSNQGSTSGESPSYCVAFLCYVGSIWRCVSDLFSAGCIAVKQRVMTAFNAVCALCLSTWSWLKGLYETCKGFCVSWYDYFSGLYKSFNGLNTLDKKVFCASILVIVFVLWWSGGPIMALFFRSVGLPCVWEYFPHVGHYIFSAPALSFDRVSVRVNLSDDVDFVELSGNLTRVNGTLWNESLHVRDSLRNLTATSRFLADKLSVFNDSLTSLIEGRYIHQSHVNASVVAEFSLLNNTLGEFRSLLDGLNETVEWLRGKEEARSVVETQFMEGVVADGSGSLNIDPDVLRSILTDLNALKEANKTCLRKEDLQMVDVRMDNITSDLQEKMNAALMQVEGNLAQLRNESDALNSTVVLIQENVSHAFGSIHVLDMQLLEFELDLFDMRQAFNGLGRDVWILKASIEKVSHNCFFLMWVFGIPLAILLATPYGNRWVSWIVYLFTRDDKAYEGLEFPALGVVHLGSFCAIIIYVVLVMSVAAYRL